MDPIISNLVKVTRLHSEFSSNANPAIWSFTRTVKI